MPTQMVFLHSRPVMQSPKTRLIMSCIKGICHVRLFTASACIRRERSTSVAQSPDLEKGQTNDEAVRLYRDVLRASKMFDWTDEKGRRWGDVLAQNARSEFEEARHEKDPLLIARMVVVGREALQKVTDQVS